MGRRNYGAHNGVGGIMGPAEGRRNYYINYVNVSLRDTMMMRVMMMMMMVMMMMKMMIMMMMMMMYDASTQHSHCRRALRAKRPSTSACT